MKKKVVDESEKSMTRKRNRRLEKEKLMENIPRVDEHGISYTKHQLRKMCKRVARGLDPVETKHEASLRLQQEAQTQREEEDEFAGLVTRSIVEDEKSLAENGGSGSSPESTGNSLGSAKNEATTSELEVNASGTHSKKKSRCSKIVPTDYVCAACQNRNEPTHWIYDCPEKVTVRGANKLAKKMRGIQNPDARKVFVSGLPFDAKTKDVTAIFLSCGQVVHCKLLRFEDTRRCKGQAILSFDTSDAARKALRLSGESIDNSSATKIGGEKNDKKRTELKLKVTKVLNRTMSKRN